MSVPSVLIDGIREDLDRLLWLSQHSTETRKLIVDQRLELKRCLAQLNRLVQDVSPEGEGE